ncbi:hypothetical protein [Clostridium rectalis]|nr:hypothetical protein [Clostridium rectalis]
MDNNIKEFLDKIKKANMEAFKTNDKLDYRKIYEERIEEFNQKKENKFK